MTMAYLFNLPRLIFFFYLSLFYLSSSLLLASVRLFFQFTETGSWSAISILFGRANKQTATFSRGKLNANQKGCLISISIGNNFPFNRIKNVFKRRINQKNKRNKRKNGQRSYLVDRKNNEKKNKFDLLCLFSYDLIYKNWKRKKIRDKYFNHRRLSRQPRKPD